MFLKKAISVFLFVFSLFAPSMIKAQKVDTMKFAHYNVENLFDTINDPNIDDEEFLPNGKMRWNSERYSRKLEHIAQVFEALNFPNWISLVEVENKTVLEDLIKQPQLKKASYNIVHFNSPDKRGIDVALLYRGKGIKLFHSSSHFVKLPDDGKYPTRDILLAGFKVTAKGPDVFVMVNHWPSRRGGESSEAKRFAAATVLKQLKDSIAKANPTAICIMAGDFNDTPLDKSIKVELGAGEDSSLPIFNPFERMAANGVGSHYYKNEYSMLDQIMITANALKSSSKVFYVSNSAKVEKPSFVFEQEGKYKGTPWRTYIGEKYLGGYSDHLPISILLIRK